MATEAVDRRRWTLVAVCVTTFMLLLDITVVNVALPRIQSSLSAGLTGLQWVVDAYALALAALILTAGALADRDGRRLDVHLRRDCLHRRVGGLRRGLEHRRPRHRARRPGGRRRGALRDRARIDRP
jgi:MoxR-like ATPase